MQIWFSPEAATSTAAFSSSSFCLYSFLFLFVTDFVLSTAGVGSSMYSITASRPSFLGISLDFHHLTVTRCLTLLLGSPKPWVNPQHISMSSVTVTFSNNPPVLSLSNFIICRDDSSNILNSQSLECPSSNGFTLHPTATT